MVQRLEHSEPRCGYEDRGLHVWKGPRVGLGGELVSWPWMPVPRRLLSEERVLDLSHADRGMLLSLYLAADEHGRFEAGSTALRRALGAFIAPN